MTQEKKITMGPVWAMRAIIFIIGMEKWKNVGTRRTRVAVGKRH